MYMRCLLPTERVVVHVRTVERDDLGEPISSVATDLPADVLVAPGATSDLDAGRPDGVHVDMTLHFPKGWATDLRGATVTVRGAEYRVVGDPSAYSEDGVPGPFSMPVEVARADG